MSVVEIQDMSHLAIGERRFGKAQLEPASEHARLRAAADLLEHIDQLAHRRVPAAGERAADPVEDAAAGLVLRGRREIAVLRRRQMAAQRLGQRHRIGMKVLVHIVDRACKSYCALMLASRMIFVQ